MKNQKLSCLFWLVLFLALAGAAAWFVYRRTADAGAATAGAFIGGILLLCVVSWLIAIPGRIAEWLLIVRAQLGREPQHGKRVALIGTLRGHGDLAAPFSHERCLAYEYEIRERVVTRSGNTTTIEDKKAYEGFAMTALSIEHGTDRTRILARPEMKLETRRRSDLTLAANAKHYIEGTKWDDGPPPKDAPDLSPTDGRYRRDHRLRPETELGDNCQFIERLLIGNANVCAIGEYSSDKRALVAPVKLRTGQSFAIGAAWRVVNAGIGLVIFAAITLVAAAVFCANYPLDAAEASSPQWTLTWPEIELERFIDREVRTRMVEAGMLSSSSGFYLQDVCDGCAKGTVVVDGRTIELKHAAYVAPKTVHLSAKPGDRDGLTLTDGKRVTLTLDGKSAPIPASWFHENDVVTALGSVQRPEYAGRITVIAPDRWLRARVTFKTRVNVDDWLPGRTPPAQP